jgi:hypothetical protein
MRLPREIAAVWALVAASLVVVLVTYARLPAKLLYHVSGTGIGAALGRVVIDLNFPGGIIALAVLAVVAGRLPRRTRPAAAAAAVLCALGTVFVHDSNLDVRWINVLPAIGVAIVFVLSFLADGPDSPRHARGDRLRIVLAAVLTVVAAPWIAAELGFYLDGVPVLGWVFQTGRIVKFGEPPHHVVHYGAHHGLYGLLFVLTALLLSRLPAGRVARVFLAILLAFGLGNMLNDGWGEQVVERGWTSLRVPSVLHFTPNWLWLAVLVGGLAVWALWFRQPSRTTPPAASSATSASP